VTNWDSTKESEIKSDTENSCSDASGRSSWINTLIENINEVMTWLEHQTERDGLLLLYLVNINKYARWKGKHQL
jgi:hypothetical protein